MSGRSQLPRRAQGFTLLITYAIKIVGLASACNQLLLTAHPTSLALAVSAFMMAGAQLSEGLVLALLDRLVAADTTHRTEQERRKTTSG